MKKHIHLLMTMTYFLIADYVCTNIIIEFYAKGGLTVSGLNVMVTVVALSFTGSLIFFLPEWFTVLKNKPLVIRPFYAAASALFLLGALMRLWNQTVFAWIPTPKAFAFPLFFEMVFPFIACYLLLKAFTESS